MTVVRNNQFALEDLNAYDRIVLSPGPGVPSEAGLLLDVIHRYAGVKTYLGRLLGPSSNWRGVRSKVEEFV